MLGCASPDGITRKLRYRDRFVGISHRRGSDSPIFDRMKRERRDSWCV